MLAPLALVLLWLAGCAWRGRLPSRPMLNAVFSALLLVYLMTTAGLGLFWVANQHLPVFDWHYLFGYAMLLVLAVHLVFNLRQLWLHLGRRPSVVPLRRPALRVLVGAGGAAAVAWHYRAATYELLPSRRHDSSTVRRQSQAAGLDQEMVGSASVVFVLTLERQRLSADPDGAARGYRHAFIEAGLIGERLYLEAEARGLGACGVGAFYDDEAVALIGVDARSQWPLHFVALGVRPD